MIHAHTRIMSPAHRGCSIPLERRETKGLQGEGDRLGGGLRPALGPLPGTGRHYRPSQAFVSKKPLNAVGSCCCRPSSMAQTSGTFGNKMFYFPGPIVTECDPQFLKSDYSCLTGVTLGPIWAAYGFPRIDRFADVTPIPDRPLGPISRPFRHP